jgi:hypothetical protein
MRHHRFISIPDNKAFCAQCGQHRGAAPHVPEHRWCVRIAYDDFQLARNAFLDALAKVGAIMAHDTVIDVLAPAEAEGATHAWATDAALVFKDMGFNAVAAPEWPKE